MKFSKVYVLGVTFCALQTFILRNLHTVQITLLQQIPLNCTVNDIIFVYNIDRFQQLADWRRPLSVQHVRFSVSFTIF